MLEGCFWMLSGLKKREGNSPEFIQALQDAQNSLKNLKRFL
jgi:hypothetical protein